jgi:hypothetical protein
MTENQLRAALKYAFQLGQTYWQQADSESYSENKKSDKTAELFRMFVDDTVDNDLKTSKAYDAKYYSARACRMKLPPVPNEADRSPVAGPAYFDYNDMDAYGLLCYNAAIAEPCPYCFANDNKVFELRKAFDALRDLLIEAESSYTPDAETELIVLQDFYLVVHAIVYTNLKERK